MTEDEGMCLDHFVQNVKELVDEYAEHCTDTRFTTATDFDSWFECFVAWRI